jgi:hypothetical protein
LVEEAHLADALSLADGADEAARDRDVCLPLDDHVAVPRGIALLAEDVSGLEARLVAGHGGHAVQILLLALAEELELAQAIASLFEVEGHGSSGAGCL